MEFAFYIFAAIALLSATQVVLGKNPIYALLYLILTLLAMSAIFFVLGAYFAAAVQVIVYAGAIMVLFVFIIMMLNLGKQTINQERAWLTPKTWIGPSILAFIMLAVLIYGITQSQHSGLTSNEFIDTKAIGQRLFGAYILIVELASMLLLSGLVVAYHLGSTPKKLEDDALNPQSNTESEKINEGEA